MAGPQFFTPQKKVTPSRPTRRFTLQQANSSLPLVRRIVADVVRIHGDAVKSQETIDKSVAGKEQTAAQKQLQQSLDRLADLVDELSSVGVEIKDYQNGLIDFVGRHEGRDVYLCWKLGEEQIEFFHELNAGFAGRQAVSELHETD
jgi:hypothetical protein